MPSIAGATSRSARRPGCARCSQRQGVRRHSRRWNTFLACLIPEVVELVGGWTVATTPLTRFVNHCPRPGSLLERTCDAQQTWRGAGRRPGGPPGTCSVFYGRPGVGPRTSTNDAGAGAHGRMLAEHPLVSGLAPAAHRCATSLTRVKPMVTTGRTWRSRRVAIDNLEAIICRVLLVLLVTNISNA